MRSDLRVKSERGVPFLLRRLKRCEKGWEVGMAKPGYRDDPEEPKEQGPFTEEETRLMTWVQAWRIRFHEYEEALYLEEEVRRGMIEGLTTRGIVTDYRSH